MTRSSATSRTIAAKVALAGVAVGVGALVLSVPAGAEPVVPTPVPGDPAAPPPPGQPMAIQEVPGGDAPPAPPPVGAPPVPEVQNQVYGSGQSSGPLGFLRDAWHQAKNPYGDLDQPMGTQPPPGAGPAPQLPPGYQSISAPESNGPPAKNDYSGGPALPPGYYPLAGPPPPGYFDGPPPPPPAAPGAYQPVVSPPPPPLLPTP